MAEIVAWIRGHLLPTVDTGLVAEDGRQLTLSLSDASVRASLCATMSADLAARAGTVLPVLVDHAGGSLGEVLCVEESPRGVDVVVGLYAGGVAAWKGEAAREYVSGGFSFGAGLRTARLIECSLTPTPQFSRGQQKIALCDRPLDDADAIGLAAAEPIVYRVVASEIATQRTGEQMTAEELAAAIDAALEARLAPLMERLAALEGAAEDLDDAADAEMADDPPMGDESADDTAVAASEIRALKAEVASLRVKAAMRAPAYQPTGAAQGGTRLDRLNHAIATGASLEGI